MNIILDAGHTDRADPGAVANNTSKHAEVVEIVYKALKLVEDDPELKDHKVMMVPTDKSLVQKIAFVNKYNAKDDLVFSTHLNSAANSSVSGCEVYYLEGNQIRRAQALLLLDSIQKALGLDARGAFGDTTTRHGRLGIIRDVHCASFLFELGFITCQRDLNVVRENGSQAIHAAVRKYVGLPILPADGNELKKKEILHMEGNIDSTLQEVQQLLSILESHLEEWKKFDLKIDGERGALLTLLEEHGDLIDNNAVTYEKTVMKKLMLENNDLIAELEDILQKRKEWYRKVKKVRGVIIDKL